jgi:exopolysaccharide production protein ExoZ
MDGGPAKLVAIQALRAVAATSVLLHHVAFFSLTTFGSGVDLFFVISGFVMAISSWTEFAERGAPRRFARRRLTRIVPLYWIATFIVVAQFLYANGRLPSTEALLRSLFFYPFAAKNPLLNPGWTLNYEMLFYAIFALCLLMRPRRGILACATVLSAMVALGCIFGPVPRSNAAFPLSLEFVFGMAVGVAYAEGLRLPKPLGLTIVIFGFGLIGASRGAWIISTYDPMRVLFWGGAGMLIVAGASLPHWNWRGLSARLATLLGDASYALYLFHPLIIWLFAHWGIGRDAWPLIAATSILASVIIHSLIEKPILSWLRSPRVTMAAPAPIGQSWSQSP